MEEFYHDSVTDKSFQFLREMNKKYRFVLIGGWAVFLYTRALKSKDIDIVLDYAELGMFRKDFTVSKNDRLRKYEIKTGEFDVDVYVSHYSDLGMPVEYVVESAIRREGFSVPSLEILFMLKLHAWQERQGSIKGRKDEIDILAIAFLEEFDWPEYLKKIGKFNFKEKHENFISFLKNTKRVPELKLGEQQVAKSKKRIMEKISLSGKE